MENELANPVVVGFPLSGEGWVAVVSPADRIPSHGTDMLGQRFAYDFMIIDDRARMHYHPAGWVRQFLVGVPTRECYAWGAPIHAPFEATILKAVDGVPERSRVHPIREALIALKNGITFTPDKLPAVLGNYVIAAGYGFFAAFVHLAPGSVAVREGQLVRAGDQIGRVGHTGNSTAPHLHFQLMDSANPMTARGIPCAFRAFEVWRDGLWVPVENGIPSRTERIRAVP